MKYVFNSILKLNNNLWRKYKIIFLWNEMPPKLVVFQSWKKLQVLEKNAFRKKIRPAYLCVQFIFFEINASPDIQLSVILRFRKIVLLHKIINKIRSTKKQENSVHSLEDNYLTNHLVKFLQDRIKPWRVGALRVCTGYHFF